MSARSDVVVANGLTPEQKRMALDNTGLIGFVLNRHKFLVGGVYEEADAWQDGFFGLARAVQKFEPELGYRFSTYALPHILAAIQRGRGRSEGKRWRNAAAVGTLDQFEAPLSLDSMVIDGEAELGDALPDDGAHPESDALAAVVAESLRSRCVKDIDHAVLDALLAGNPVSWVADAFGVSKEWTRRRAERLRAEAARLYPEVAMT
jgi:RNA polymerase sigma factor (sigma-70 family)